MEHSAERLKNTNKSAANAYRLKTGMSEDELLDLMNKETWLTAQQAKELKFVDEIMFDEGNQLVASSGISNMIPIEVINKLRNELNNSPIFPKAENKPADGVIDINLKSKQKGEQEEMEIKNATELKESIPAVYDEVYNAGVNAEKERLQAIDELAGKVDNDLLKEAKYTNSMTAEIVALKAMKEGKFVNIAHIDNTEKDAETANKVPGASTEVLKGEEDAQVLNVVSQIAKDIVNSIKKGGR
jgi:ClpP class serine protease